MSLHRGRRKSEHTGSFIDGKAAKEPQLHNSALLRIEFGEFFQGVVQRNQIQTSAFEFHRVIQSQRAAPVPFGGTTAAGVLDQDVAHQLSTDGYEVLTVLKMGCALFLQAEIRLMHQGRALQGVIWAFLAHVMMSQSPKLVINERQNRAQSFVVACVPLRQKPTDGLGRK